MRTPATVLGLDVIASLAIVEWSYSGLWVDLYGFRASHPGSALAYFRGLVSAGCVVFVIVFLLTSCILCFRRLESHGYRSWFDRVFHRDRRAIVVKYSTLFFAALVCPVFYRIMWSLNQPRTIRILGGFAMTALTFMAAAIVADWFVVGYQTERSTNPT